LKYQFQIKKVVHKLPGFKLQFEIYCGSNFFVVILYLSKVFGFLGFSMLSENPKT
jgi:hypothetical protein